MSVPKAALFFLGNAVAEDTATADIRLSIGAADGTTEWAFATFADDGATTINVKRFSIKDGVIALHSDTAITSRANFVTFIENGVRINWTAVSGTGKKGFVVFFTGPTCEAKVGLIESPSMDGMEVDTGFSSEMIYFVSNFVNFASNDDRFGISQGVALSGTYSARTAVAPYGGADGLVTTTDSVQGVIDRAHFTRETAGYVASENLSGEVTGALRGALLVPTISPNSFFAQASNGFAALKDYGYLALGFAKRARITMVDWDMSNKAPGTYTQVHSAGTIQALEAVFMLPVSALAGNETANVGFGVMTGENQALITGRGSASLAGGTFEKSSFSFGDMVYGEAVSGDGSLTITYQGWSEGEIGWDYTIASAAKPNKKFTCIVLGRIEDCYPKTWQQAQIMEPA